MSIIRKFGKASAAVLKNTIAPMVGQADLADSVGYIENAGAPTSVLPAFIGQILFDTSNSAWYKAYGTSTGNWVLQGVAAVTYSEFTLLDGATFTVAEANLLTGMPVSASVASSALASGSARMDFVFTNASGTAITTAFVGRAYFSTTGSASDYTAVSGLSAISGATNLGNSASFDFVTTVSGRLAINIVKGASSSFVTFNMPTGKKATSTVLTTS